VTIGRGGEGSMMRGIFGLDPGWGVTVVRVVMGALLAGHGYAKLADGVGGVATFFAEIGIPLPEVSAVLVMLLELVGGLFLVIGLFARWLGLLYTIQFLVIVVYVKHFPAAGLRAVEYELMLLGGAVLLLLAGGGRASVDQLWLERKAG
jgi:putative oxidoreductase